MKQTKFGISLKIPRKLDRRWKLTEKQIFEIQDLFRTGVNCHQLSKRFHVSPLTIRYWIDPQYRREQQAKNAKRKRTPEEETTQLVNKQRRRNILRPLVQEYTRIQMASWRKENLLHCRQRGRIYARAWRAKNPERARLNGIRYWYRNHAAVLIRQRARFRRIRNIPPQHWRKP